MSHVVKPQKHAVRDAKHRPWLPKPLVERPYRYRTRSRRSIVAFRRDRPFTNPSIPPRHLPNDSGPVQTPIQYSPAFSMSSVLGTLWRFRILVPGSRLSINASLHDRIDAVDLRMCCACRPICFRRRCYGASIAMPNDKSR